MNQFATLILLSILPGLFWVWYFARQDREREPLHMLLRTFFAGALSVLPAVLLEMPLRSILSTGDRIFVLLALLAVGFVEEGVKLLAAYRAAFISPHFNEAVDGIIYAITAALGFAATENLFYTVRFGAQVAVVRSVVTSLAHASFAGVYGVAAGRVHMGLGSKKNIFVSFIIAALLHSFYDFIVVEGVLPPIFALLLIYAVYHYVVTQLRQLATIN